MRADRFQIHQPKAVIDGVPKQKHLALTAKFVNQQVGQAAFLSIPNGRSGRDDSYRVVNVGRYVVVEFLVLPGKAPRLLHFIRRARRPRDTNGVACSRGSAIEISDSAMNEAGRSGLSKAALRQVESQLRNPYIGSGLREQALIRIPLI